MSDDAQVIIEHIGRAFAGVRLEDGVSLREADVIDDYGTELQRQEARSQDELLDWRRIPEDLIAGYSSCLSFFDARGMRFHLPAYMCFALRHYRDSDSASIDSTIYTLGYDDERCSLLAPEQRTAVREFLEFMAFHGGGCVDTDQAKRALEDIWMRRTENSQQDAPPSSRPPSQLASSPETQTPGSQRTSASGGCG